MNHWIIGALVGFLIGVGIAFLNHAISLAVLRKKPNFYSATSMIRQLIHILFLLALYFLAPYTPWGMMELLIGGVIGLTIPMFFLTSRLVRESEQQKNAGTEPRAGQPSGDEKEE